MTNQTMHAQAGSALEAVGLRFRYRRSGEELFGGLDHRFTPGRVTAITGPSGRGKSTLLYVLGLLLKPSAGDVLLESRSGWHGGNRADAQRARLRAQHFGFVFQDAELDPSRPIIDSVIEPGLYAGRRRSDLLDPARRLLADFGVDHRADHRPGQISGGQAQRVAICRALINNPLVVLADEPTGNLDPDNAATVLTRLRATSRTGVTVLIASHDPQVLDQSDEVVQL